MLTFNAIDVETANADRASICQIGVVQVRDGKIDDQWETLINPETWFDPWNVKIHGITADRVKDEPTLPQAFGELCRWLTAPILVSHTSFDRIAIERATERCGLERPPITWLDSARVARRAWPGRYGKGGYRLKNVANDLGISFRHHDALEDARAAAEVVLRACADTGVDVEAWLRVIKRRKSASAATPEANLEGTLFGETVVFTGTLRVDRAEAQKMAADAGCHVKSNITKRVTMLVVGTQDLSRLKGYAKSNKHRKAEDLIEQGVAISVLSEADFFRLVGGV